MNMNTNQLFIAGYGFSLTSREGLQKKKKKRTWPYHILNEAPRSTHSGNDSNQLMSAQCGITDLRLCSENIRYGVDFKNIS
jgi:hypothetical protein